MKNINKNKLTIRLSLQIQKVIITNGWCNTFICMMWYSCKTKIFYGYKQLRRKKDIVEKLEVRNIIYIERREERERERERAREKYTLGETWNEKKT